MNINALLGSHTCACGRTHGCAIKTVRIGDGVIGELHALLEDYRHILLAADNNTYAVCGEAVRAQLGEKLEKLLVYQTEGYLIPNEDAVARMEEMLTEKTDLIIGIGSGVMQDLCKYVSHRAGLPYHIVATAPSMDGYASVGAAMIMGNMKVTYNAHVPEAIIGDTRILRDAPMEMIQAGYGDILGKFSCLNDWKLSHVVNGEYLCQEVYDLTWDMLQSVKDLGRKLQERDPQAIQTLMEALVGVGVAMAYMGNSRPASGSEHHLSHFFEVVGILEDAPYFAHGIDVAFSAVYTQALREGLLARVRWDDKAKREPAFAWEPWEHEIRRIYTGAAEGVIALQRKLGWYEINRLPIYEEKWDNIRSVLEEAPSARELTGYLDSVGLDIRRFEEVYGREKIQNALLYGKDLKDRYSVLWLNWDLNS